MYYTTVALKDRIMEMYPEISDQQIQVGLVFNKEKDAYIVTFRKDREALSTHLERKDAEECMNGIKCVYLGVQIEQFIRNFNERRAFTANVA